MTRQPISHLQYCQLYAAIERCSAGMTEARARRFERGLMGLLLRDFRVPKRERRIGRRLPMPNLGALRAADFEQALATVERLAQLPV